MRHIRIGVTYFLFLFKVARCDLLKQTHWSLTKFVPLSGPGKFHTGISCMDTAAFRQYLFLWSLILDAVEQMKFVPLGRYYFKLSSF